MKYDCVTICLLNVHTLKFGQNIKIQGKLIKKYYDRHGNVGEIYGKHKSGSEMMMNGDRGYEERVGPERDKPIF